MLLLWFISAELQTNYESVCAEKKVALDQINQLQAEVNRLMGELESLSSQKAGLDQTLAREMEVHHHMSELSYLLTGLIYFSGLRRYQAASCSTRAWT